MAVLHTRRAWPKQGFAPSRPSPLADKRIEGDYSDSYEDDPYSRKRKIVVPPRAHPISPPASSSDSAPNSDENFNSRSLELASKLPTSPSSPKIDQYGPGIPSDLFDLLQDFSLFKNAPPSFLHALSTRLKPLHVSPQRFIITQGDGGKTMYWLVRGVVDITSRDGETTYATLQPGNFFGEIGLLFDRPRTANVVARTKCLLMALTAGDLNEILPSYPAVERAIRDEAQERLVILERSKLSKQIKVDDMIYDDSFDKNEHDYVVSMERAKKKRKVEPDASSTASVPYTTGTNIYLHLDNTPFLFLKDILKEIPIFESLPQHILHELAMAVEPATYAPFEYIVRQGTTGKDIYFIVEGTAEVIEEHITDERSRFLDMKPPSATRDDSSIPAESPIMKRIAMLRKGAYFGEMAYLSSSPIRSASVRSVSQVDCLVLTEQTLASLCGGFPSIQSEFEKTAALRQQKQSEDQECCAKSQGDEINEKSVPPPSMDISEEVATTFDPNSQAQAAVAAAGIASQVPAASRFASFFGGNIRSGSSRRSSLGLGGSSRRRGSRFNIGVFPESVLTRIFQHLELPDLMRMQLVCQQWRQILLNSPMIMRVLDLTKYNTSIDDKSIVPIINFAGTRPKVVDISNCFHLTDDGFSYLVNGIGLAKVKVFRMRSVWEVSGMAIMDLSVPSIGSELEEIDLSNCRKVDDLTVIRLVGWVVPETNADGVTPITFPPPGTVVGCPKLKRLNFSYCKGVTDRTMFHIATYVSDRLESLDLTRCTSITDLGFSYWASRSFPKLQQINLSDCTFLTDKAIIDLILIAPYITELNLSFCCSLTDVSVEAIGMNCTHLRKLDLSFCGSAVSDKSLSVLASNLRNLEYLNVRGCIRVTNMSVNLLWQYCRQLKELNITQCKNVVPYKFY